METREQVIIGAPCWLDLSTSDLTRATDFYGHVFGWTAADSGEAFGHYAIFGVGDAEVGGVMQKTPDMQGVPDMWTIYLAAEDAAAVCEKVTRAGGQVLSDPMPVGDIGIMAVLADPVGAVFGVWQAGTFPGIATRGQAHTPIWFELQTRDAKAAEAFYREVFSLDVTEPAPSPEGPAYQMFQVDDVPLAGLFDMRGVAPDEVPSYWTVYIGVPDVDGTARAIEETGGSIITPVMDSSFGRWATVADPMGAVFVIMKM
jgi:predicted enzyme related to lactoylglutathione lyase